MAYTLCEKLQNLTPYEPVQGDFEIRSDANESFLTPPSVLCEKIAKAISEVALNRYPDPMAVELRAAYADYLGVSPEFVGAGNGSDELIGVLAQAFVQAGEPIMVIEPDFSMYHFYASLCEHPLVRVQKNADFTIDVDAVLEAARETGAKMIIFSNPCNPTTIGLPREEVLRLCAGTDALVVVDEAYMDFWDQSIVADVPNLENVLVLRTCSKLVGLAALRVGFTVANRRLTQAVLAAKAPYNIGAVTQAIATTVLRDRGYLASCLNSILASTRELDAGIREVIAEKGLPIQIPETATNFLYIPTDRAEEVEKAFNANKIAIRRFSGALRISACAPEDNQRMIRTLRDAL